MKYEENRAVNDDYKKAQCLFQAGEKAQRYPNKERTDNRGIRDPSRIEKRNNKNKLWQNLLFISQGLERNIEVEASRN